MQVHKETIDKIPGAIPGRDSVDVEVYGMDGIPQEYDGGPSEAKKKPILPSAPAILPTSAPPVAGTPHSSGMIFPNMSGMVQPNPYMQQYYGMMANQMPPRPGLVPTIPLPQSIPQPIAMTSHIPLPTTAVHSIPQPTAFPAYQQRTVGDAHVPTTIQPSSSAASTSSAPKPLGSKTRIVVPDEIVSLEELMAQRLETLSRARY